MQESSRRRHRVHHNVQTNASLDEQNSQRRTSRPAVSSSTQGSVVTTATAVPAAGPDAGTSSKPSSRSRLGSNALGFIKQVVSTAASSAPSKQTTAVNDRPMVSTGYTKNASSSSSKTVSSTSRTVNSQPASKHGKQPAAAPAPRLTKAQQAAAAAAAEAEKQRREQEEMRRDQERVAMMHEEQLCWSVQSAVSSYMRSHAEAVDRIRATHADAVRRLEARAASSQAKLSELRSSAYKKTLKADLKKGMGVAKRVSAMTEENVSAVLKDVCSINLSRYSSEIGLAIGADKSLSPQDIHGVVVIATAMHQRYQDFTPVLMHTVLSALAVAVEVCGVGAGAVAAGATSATTADASAAKGKASAVGSPSAQSSAAAGASNPVLSAIQGARSRLPLSYDMSMEGDGGVSAAAVATAAKDSVDSDPRAAATRLRVLLRLILELHAAGIFTDNAAVMNIITGMMGDAGKEGRDIAVVASKMASGAGQAASPAALALTTTNALHQPRTPVFALPSQQQQDRGKPATLSSIIERQAPSSAPTATAQSPRPPPPLSAPAVTDKVAKRCVRELPLVLSLLKHCGEDLTGIQSRSTRVWLSGLPSKCPTAATAADPRSAWAGSDGLRDWEDQANVSLDSAAGGGVGGRERALPSQHRTTPSTGSAASSSSSSLSIPTSTAESYPAAWLDARHGLAPPPTLTVPVATFLHGLLVLQGPVSPPLPPSAFNDKTGALQVKSPLFSANEQWMMLAACDRYCDAVFQQLLADNKAVRRKQRRLYLAQFQREPTDKLQLEMEQQKEAFERLHKTVSDLADCLDRDVPVMPTGFDDLGPDTDEVKAGAPGSVTVWSGFGGELGSLGPFDSEVDRAFYRDVLDLPQAVPAAVLDPDAARAALEKQAAAGAAMAAKKLQFASVARPAVTDRRKGTLTGALEQLYGKSQANQYNRGVGVGANVKVVSEEGGDGTAGEGPDDDEDEDADANDAGSVDDDAGSVDNQQELAEIMASDAADADATPGASFGSFTVGAPAAAGVDGGVGVADQYRYNAMLDSLRKTGSKESIDAWAVDFLLKGLNNRKNRHRLTKFLFNAPSQNTDLYPFYARLATIMDTGVKDFSKPLVTLLSEEFKYLMKRRPHSHADLKTKDVRMLGELCKFGACPPPVIFACAKACLSDFGNAMAVEVLSCLVTTCGRYLYLCPDTRETTVRMLDAMKREKASRKLTGSVAAMVDDAWYTCVPSDRPVRKAKVRPHLHSFLRFLVLEHMAESNVDECLKIVRKLPWSTDASIPLYLCKTVIASTRCDGKRLECVASLLSGLRAYHDAAVVRCIDALADCVVQALGPPLQGGADTSATTADATAAAPASTSSSGAVAGMAQRRVGSIRLFGHCYEYECFESPAVFRLAYTVMNWGHGVPAQQAQAGINAANVLIAQRQARKAWGGGGSTGIGSSPEAGAGGGDGDDDDDVLPPYPMVLPPQDPGHGGWGFHPFVPCPADPPTNTFRIRLLAELLWICGPFYERGRAAARLDRFLVYFQRYVLSKGAYLPMDTLFMVQDLLERIRPQTKMFTSFAEAEQAAAALEREEAWAAAEAAHQARDITAGDQPAGASGDGGGGPAATGQHAVHQHHHAHHGFGAGSDGDDDDDDFDLDLDGLELGEDDDEVEEAVDDDGGEAIWDDAEVADEDEEAGEAQQGDEEGDEEAGSDGGEDEEGDGDENGAGSEDDGESTDEEQQAAASAMAEEVDEFDLLLRQTVSSSLDQARLESRQAVSSRANLVVPLHLSNVANDLQAPSALPSSSSSSQSPSAIQQRQLSQFGDGLDQQPSSSAPAPAPVLRLTVLQRHSKGSGIGMARLEAKTVDVPTATVIAEASLRGAAELRAEHEETKRATLALVERQAEEERWEAKKASWASKKKGRGGVGGEQPPLAMAGATPTPAPAVAGVAVPVDPAAAAAATGSTPPQQQPPVDDSTTKHGRVGGGGRGRGDNRRSR